MRTSPEANVLQIKDYTKSVQLLDRKRVKKIVMSFSSTVTAYLAAISTASDLEGLSSVAFTSGGAASIPEFELYALAIHAWAVATAVSWAFVTTEGFPDDAASAAVSYANPEDPGAHTTTTSAVGQCGKDRWAAIPAASSYTSGLHSAHLTSLSDGPVVGDSRDRAHASLASANLGSDAGLVSTPLAGSSALDNLHDTSLQFTSDLDNDQSGHKASTEPSAWGEYAETLLATASWHAGFAAHIASIRGFTAT